MNTTKIERLEARVSAEQKDLFLHAANLLGRSLTDFMLNSLTEAAKNIIAEHQLISLSARDQKAFVQALLNKTSKPNKNLLAASKRHKKEVKE